MPRKGPKKVTRRDDRDLERCAERSKALSAAVRAKNADKVLGVYKAQSNPNIPSSKGERRALREALSAEGVSMERWNSGKFEECFFHIARDRYVNNKFTDAYSEAAEENAEQWENDSWLQMYLHVPEDYREKVAKVIEPFTPSPAEEVTCKNQSPTNKLSRNQAKAMTEGAVNLCPTLETEGSTSQPTSETLPAAAVAAPEGKVKIINHHKEVLCADATGTVQWRDQTDVSAAQDAIWTVEPTLPGKCNLRSAHGRFLCHCMWAGVVADRTAASWWEEWEISEAGYDNCPSEEVVFTLKSWRNVYIGQSEDKVTVADKIDVSSIFVIKKAV